MKLSEAEQIFELADYLPLDFVVYVSNEYKYDHPLHANGWYACFETLGIKKMYQFEVAEGMCIAALAMIHKENSVCD